MLEDSQGNLWFGTNGGGANRYDGKSFTHFTTKEGLSNNKISSMLEDRQGRLWLTTMKGISLLIFSDEEMKVGQNPNAAKKFIYTFGKVDGLIRWDFEINSTCLDRDNRIWWGSIDGLAMLDLNRFELPDQPPRNVQLTNIEINQEFLDFRSIVDPIPNNLQFGLQKNLTNYFDSVVPFNNYPVEMSLPYNTNHLTFHFTAIDWTAPHKIQYQYFLEGLEKYWSVPQSENKADYRNLPHGTFTLKVRARGVAQIWSKPFKYTFTILPPWWLTWWIKSIYALIILGALYLIYRFLVNRQLARAETHRLRELDEVKTRLYTNITHEFRTPLTVIQGMADKILQEPKDWLINGVRMIKRNSQTLLNLVNQMLDLAKLEAGKLKAEFIQADIIPFLKYNLESLQSLAESKDIRLHFFSDLDHLVVDYDADKIRHIVFNLISNGIKYTPAGGTVIMEVSRSEKVFQMTIKDTGVGIPADQLPNIFDRFYQVDTSSTRQQEGTGIGLALTKELVNLLEGEYRSQK